MTSAEILRRLKEDGWFEVRVKGSHHQFQHKTKPGTVTVQHPLKDVYIENVKSIEKQSGIKLR